MSTTIQQHELQSPNHQGLRGLRIEVIIPSLHLGDVGALPTDSKFLNYIWWYVSLVRLLSLDDRGRWFESNPSYLYCAVADSVRQRAVNSPYVGSSPTCTVIYKVVD